MGFLSKGGSEPRQAYWSISSASDPRWNASGTCCSGIFSIAAACETAIQKKKETLGEPPADLNYGGVKE